jgi:hypothetical protein
MMFRLYKNSIIFTSFFSLTICRLSDETNDNLMIKDEPANDWEKRVYAIWCGLLPSPDVTMIRMTTHFFSLGGNSLQLMKILAAYRNLFGCATRFPNINTFFEHATIRKHAQLLEQAFSDDIMTEEKRPLQAFHATQGEPVLAFFAWLFC